MIVTEIYLRLLCHVAYFFLSLVAGFLGVLWVGVRLIGDNPGALFGGILSFFACFLFCLSVEALWRSRLLRGGSLGRVALELVCALSAGLAASWFAGRFLWADYEFTGFAWPMFRFLVVFQAIDAAVYWAAKWFAGLPSAYSPGFWRR